LLEGVASELATTTMPAITAAAAAIAMMTPPPVSSFFFAVAEPERTDFETDSDAAGFEGRPSQAQQPWSPQRQRPDKFQDAFQTPLCSSIGFMALIAARSNPAMLLCSLMQHR